MFVTQNLSLTWILFDLSVLCIFWFRLLLLQLSPVDRGEEWITILLLRHVIMKRGKKREGEYDYNQQKYTIREFSVIAGGGYIQIMMTKSGGVDCLSVNHKEKFKSHFKMNVDSPESDVVMYG